MAIKEQKIPSPSEIAQNVQQGETKKFSPEELQKLQNLQTQTTNIVNAFGQLKISELRLDSQLNYLKDQLELLKNQESELAKSLSEKYGKGTLNAETGEFTPSK